MEGGMKSNLFEKESHPSVIHPGKPQTDIVVTIREYVATDHESLVGMYQAFEPKCAFLGLPPHSEPLIRKWLDELRASGAIFFVIEAGSRIVGHAMLCPSYRGSSELAIFVHQDYRGQGLGGKLLLGVLHFACKTLQLKRVWVDVQSANVGAISLFKWAGFRSTGQSENLRWELELERPLSCNPCLLDHCAIFGAGLPVRIHLMQWTNAD
jgi:RimJ/RimL family protein N-acetyltransferase